MGVPESQSLKAPPLGTVLGERYRLLRFLGHGAIGAVYEAATPSDQRLAVKVLLEIQHQRLASEMAQRFVREAQLASTLDDEHIVPVVDSGMDASLKVPYLVMPLLSGLDVATLLEQAGALHPTVAVRAVVQACTGLQVAHKADVVHRDIKPGNLYLEHHSDGSVIVRVLDFGLAKMAAEDQSITAAGSIMGTPHYMAPEQSRNAKDVDARADVWGMAATLYHALSGVAPFEEERRFADLHMAINTRDVMRIQERAPWIDPALARVVHGGLLRDRALRCPSIRELARALEPFTGGSTKLNAMMLESAPAVLRRMRAQPAGAVEVWEPSIPSSQMPPVSNEPIDPLLGRRLDGRYTLLRILGRRAGGRLYEAIGPDGNRFAVRVLDPSGEDKAVAARRVLREAKALLTIDSPHVVKLLDAAFDEQLGLPFVVMELMHGLDLGRVIDKHGPLDPHVVVPLIVQACQGLSAAHAQGIVHRDVRPATLFLEEQPGGELCVKLTGFGLVRRTPKVGEQTYSVTRSTDIVGSPRHMSPEQARNPSQVDHRTDIWSLGATLFHALCGKPPWAELSGGNLLLHVGNETPPHVQNGAPWAKRALAEVVHRAMRRDLDSRYQAASDLAQALEPLSLMTSVTMRDLGPLPTSMRGRIEDRAPAPDRSFELHELPREQVARQPLPPTQTSSALADARRRAAARATWLLVVAIGLLALAALGGYLAWSFAG